MNLHLIILNFGMKVSIFKKVLFYQTLPDLKIDFQILE